MSKIPRAATGGRLSGASGRGTDAPRGPSTSGRDSVGRASSQQRTASYQQFTGGASGGALEAGITTSAASTAFILSTTAATPAGNRRTLVERRSSAFPATSRYTSSSIRTPISGPVGGPTSRQLQNRLSVESDDPAAYNHYLKRRQDFSSARGSDFNLGEQIAEPAPAPRSRQESRTPSINSTSSKEVKFVKSRFNRPSLPVAVTSWFPFRRNKSRTNSKVPSTEEEEEEDSMWSQDPMSDQMDSTEGHSIARGSISSSHTGGYSGRSSLRKSSQRSSFRKSPVRNDPGSSGSQQQQSVFPAKPNSLFASTSSSTANPNFLDVPSPISPTGSGGHSLRTTPWGSPFMGNDASRRRQPSHDSSSTNLPHQKSSESHDSTASAMSMNSGSGGGADEFPHHTRLRRAGTEVSGHHKRHVHMSPEEPTSSGGPATTTKNSAPIHRQVISAWKKAFGSFNPSSKSRQTVEKPAQAEAPAETDDSTDALYRFLRCKQCSKGEKCNDPQCPGRDPNQLPSITKHDLGAEQRKAVLKKTNPRPPTVEKP